MTESNSYSYKTVERLDYPQVWVPQELPAGLWLYKRYKNRGNGAVKTIRRAWLPTIPELKIDQLSSEVVYLSEAMSYRATRGIYIPDFSREVVLLQELMVKAFEANMVTELEVASRYDRVQKLFNLANGTNNEYEREVSILRIRDVAKKFREVVRYV